MGAPGGPASLKTVVQGHIRLMRVYADELDDQPSLIKRRDVVNRIHKCADELEARVNELQ